MISCVVKSSKDNLLLLQKEIPFDYEIITSDKDSLVFYDLVNILKNRKLSLNEYIISIGECFLGIPYVASTLEIEGDENLVVNLHEMDCTTFVEYVTAASLCFSENLYDFGDFAKLLLRIRYYDGKILGYPSRLHYFSGWLQNNHKKGVIDIISDSIGNAVFDNKVNFMTSNPHLYRQLRDAKVIEQLKEVENEVSLYRMRYISKDKILQIEKSIMDGDIIAFASSINGLDVSHVGFAVFRDGKLHLMHASSTTKQVEISSVPLYEYIKNRSNITGILVGRVCQLKIDN